MRENKIKRALKEGKVVQGMLQFTAHPDITEMLGAIGWDFVQFEVEHSITIDEGKRLIVAADAANITPMAKLAGLDPFQIAHWLDAGAQGIKIQHISNRSEAEQAVRACKYAPIGIRSSCGGARCAGFHAGDGYAKRMNEEVMVVLTIEDLEGMKNMESIASVEGVDAIAIGPGDMSTALGVPGQLDHPKVRDAYMKLIDTCRSKGVASAVNTSNLEQAGIYVEKGAQMVVFSRDIRVIYESLQRVKGALNEKLGGAPILRR